MDTVTFGGKEYTKASLVAKRFGYTADYIGQLCRSGKVAARLVGRSWYVDIDSIHEHRSTKYSKESVVGQKSADRPQSNYLNRVDVEPILNRKIVKLLRNTGNGASEVSVRYEADEYALIPKVEKEAVSKNLAINPAEGERVKVHKEPNQEVRFRAEPLPEVSLAGKLSVEEYIAELDEPAVLQREALTTIEPKVHVEPIKLEKQRDIVSESTKVKVRIRRDSTSKVETAPVQPSRPIVKKALFTPEKRVDDMGTKSTSVGSVTRSPATLPKAHSEVVRTPRKESDVNLATLKIPPVETPKSSLAVSLMVAILFALVASALLTATEAEITVTDKDFTSKLVVQMANLPLVFSR